jgi:DNA repair exonuclease SbcCD ATPase subunit
MCRSQGEPNGPKRCPAHARIQLEKSIAAVEELEEREAQFRAALAVALEKSQQTHVAVERLNSLERALRSLEASIEDDPEEDPEYVQLRQAVHRARRHHDAVRPDSSAALSVLHRRREQAAEALVAAGVSATEAGAHLDDIEVDSGFAPPF